MLGSILSFTSTSNSLHLRNVVHVDRDAFLSKSLCTPLLYLTRKLFSIASRNNTPCAAPSLLTHTTSLRRAAAVHCWASRHSLGFEHEDLGSSPGYLLPKQAGGTPQILVFITLRMTGRPTVYNECFAMAIDLTWTATDRATALISFIH